MSVLCPARSWSVCVVHIVGRWPLTALGGPCWRIRVRHGLTGGGLADAFDRASLVCALLPYTY